MKKLTILSLALVLSALALLACEKDRGVRADSSEYQPRPAPTSGEIKGELVHVDPKGKTIGIRLENGMEQTFQVDSDLTVKGPPSPKQADSKKSSKSSKVTT